MWPAKPGCGSRSGSCAGLKPEQMRRESAAQKLGSVWTFSLLVQPAWEKITPPEALRRVRGEQINLVVTGNRFDGELSTESFVDAPTSTTNRLLGEMNSSTIAASIGKSTIVGI